MGAALGEPITSRPRLHPGIDKRARRLTGGIAEAPLPIARIYILTDGDASTIETLGSQDRFAALAHHAYCGGLVPRTEPAHTSGGARGSRPRGCRCAG